MTDIKKVGWDEAFPERSPTTTTLSPEMASVKALGPGEAICFPCRWEHRGYLCNGTALAYQTAHRHGFKIRSTCRDKVVYVGRKQ